MNLLPASRVRTGAWPWLLLLGGVLALTGLALWLAARPPQEGSPAVTFARDMRLHHTQAVDLSMRILERPVSAPVRLLAQDIAVTQGAQTGQMGGWLDIWKLPFAGREAPMAGMDRSAMGMASDADVLSLGTLPAAQAEAKYLQLMLQHHRGGVLMAQSGLNSGVPQVQTLARAIAASQSAEIALIARMLRERGAPVPAGLPVAGGGMDMDH